jgi:DNA-binding transcriptional LysR family regulator
LARRGLVGRGGLRRCRRNAGGNAEDRSERIVGLLAEGVADIGILSSNSGVERLEVRFFRDDHYVLIVSRGHKLAKHRSILLANLKEEDFVAGPSHGLIVQEAERLGIRPRVRVRVESFDAVCRLVASGAGVGIVPESTAARIGTRSSLAVIALRDKWAARQLLLCVRNSKQLSPSARALFDHLSTAERRRRSDQ